MRDYDSTVKNLREAAKGLLFDAMPYRASVMRDAADAIEELLAELEEYKRSDKLAVKTIDSMAGQLASAPRWISVEERLPSRYETVLLNIQTCKDSYVTTRMLCVWKKVGQKNNSWKIRSSCTKHDGN